MTLLVALTVLAVVGLCYGFLVLFRVRRARRPALARSAAPARARDDVRFTVYRPASVEVERWYELLVYAHRAEGPIHDGGWQPDLSDTVRREALQALGNAAPSYRTATEDAVHPIVRDSQLEFVPEIAGFQFNPPRIVLDWAEELHRAHFRMKVDAALVGTTARGQLTIFNGPLIVAQLALVVRVAAEAPAEEPVRSLITPYRRVFASYARTDTEVVRRLREYARALGDEYLIDVADIRAGEQWEPRIEQLIAQADVFQLFWSWNAIASEYVQREWRYALSLGRPNFIRPVYWEEPLPQAPDRGLPPPELRTVHFQHVRIGGHTRDTAPSAVPPPPTSVAHDTTVQAAAPVPPGASAPHPSTTRSPAPAAPRRRRSRLPALATAAMLVVAIGGIGLYQFGMRGESSPAATRPADTDGVDAGGGAPARPPVAPPAVPPPNTVAPAEPAPATPAPAAIVLGRFEAPAGDSALLRLADELRRGIVPAWGSAATLAPPGTDPMAAARTAGGDVLVTATLASTGEGVRVDVLVTDVRTGGERVSQPVVVARGTSLDVLVRLVIDAVKEQLG